MLEGVYSSQYNNLSQTYSKGNATCYPSRRFGNIRYTKNLNYDTYDKKEANQKTVVKVLLGAVGIVGAVALGKKIVKSDKVNKFLKKIGFAETPEKILKEAREEASLIQAKKDAKGIIKKAKKSHWLKNLFKRKSS